MKLSASIAMWAGGPGSGCHGSNCGRPSKGYGKKTDKYDPRQESLLGPEHKQELADQKKQQLKEAADRRYAQARENKLKNLDNLDSALAQRENSLVQRRYGTRDLVQHERALENFLGHVQSRTKSDDPEVQKYLKMAEEHLHTARTNSQRPSVAVGNQKDVVYYLRLAVKRYKEIMPK